MAISYFTSRETILVLSSVIVPVFIFFFFYYNDEPAEVSAIVSACYILVVGQIFPFLCNWGVTCLYEQSPLVQYVEIYALVGASSAGFIASYEVEHKLTSYFESELVDGIKVISSMIFSILIGFILLKYNVVLNLRIKPIVALLPAYWMFYHGIYRDWP